ncbi:MAG: hypothetical protein EBR01_02415 [Proteobacteria bacterium]|jgi:hypothetical protein|nr:hypothetical protein [Pseudomonadota bacterium]
MKLLNSVLLIVLSVVVLPSFSNAQTEDKNTLLQIAQGDKLVLKQDLNIPANTERLFFGLQTDTGTKVSGCALLVVPSLKSRRIVSGGELLFSGVSEKSQVRNQFGYIDYVYTAKIMNSDAVTGVECYGNSLDHTYQDLYVSGMKNELKDTFDFVPAEPEIVH